MLYRPKPMMAIRTLCGLLSLGVMMGCQQTPKPPLRVVTIPVKITVPQQALQQCPTRTLDPTLHFSDYAAVAKAVAVVGLNTKADEVECDAKHQALVNSIPK